MLVAEFQGFVEILGEETRITAAVGFRRGGVDYQQVALVTGSLQCKRLSSVSSICMSVSGIVTVSLTR